MNKTIIILSEDIEEVEKLKRWLINDSYTIKAASTLKIKPAELLEHNMDLIIVYTMSEGIEDMLGIYETARQSGELSHVPLILITDMDTQKILAENLVLVGTRVLSTAVTEENLVNIVASILA